MATVRLALSPSFVSLKLEQGSYASSETRLDFSVSIDGPEQIVDHVGSVLSGDSWSLRIHDASCSVRTEDGQHGAGSMRYRPPPPSMTESPGDCVVEVALSNPAFASLLAVCISGRMPERFYVEVAGVEESGDNRFTWDRSLLPTLTVTSLSLTADLPNN
jgi:hypothetical protein